MDHPGAAHPGCRNPLAVQEAGSSLQFLDRHAPNHLAGEAAYHEAANSNPPQAANYSNHPATRAAGWSPNLLDRHRPCCEQTSLKQADLAIAARGAWCWAGWAG